MLPFDCSDFIGGVDGVINKSFDKKEMHFAEARLNDGQRLLAFNDLFIGAASHVSARYKITFNSKTEEQSSSGLIVSTSAGSTGWLSSVFNMAYGVAGYFDKTVKPKKPKVKDNELLFAVREPFKSIKTQTNIAAGIVKVNSPLKIESLMPASGVIFSDGIEADFMMFNSGSIATIGISNETACLVTNPNKL